MAFTKTGNILTSSLKSAVTPLGVGFGLMDYASGNTSPVGAAGGAFGGTLGSALGGSFGGKGGMAKLVGGLVGGIGGYTVGSKAGNNIKAGWRGGGKVTSNPVAVRPLAYSTNNVTPSYTNYTSTQSLKGGYGPRDY